MPEINENPISRYILGLKSPDEAEDYFQTLLDFSIPEHRTFFNDFKMRLFNSKSIFMDKNSI